MTESQPDLSALNLPALKQVQGLVPNLHIVSPELLRGMQPSAQALALLKEAGIKTIINLRAEDALVKEEGNRVRALGLKYVSIPMNVFEYPSKEQIDEFLSTVANPKNQPVFVHCQHGEDRTGTMCAIYRIGVQGWMLEKAYKEMLAYGFKPILVNLSETVLEYAQSKGKAGSASPLATMINETFGFDHKKD